MCLFAFFLFNYNKMSNTEFKTHFAPPLRWHDWPPSGISSGSIATTFIPDIGAPVMPVANTIIVTGISGLQTENGGVNTLVFNNLRDLTDYVVDPNGTSQY